MVSFSFIKKSTKTTTIKTSNDKEYITTFSNAEKTTNHIAPLNLPVEKKKVSFSLQKRNIKDFITNDIPINPKISIKAAANNVSILSDRRYEDLILARQDKMRGIKTRKPSNRKKVDKKPEKSKKPVEGAYAIIVSGKYINRFGKITYVSEEGDIVALRVDELNRDVKCRVTELRLISEEAYYNLVNSSIEIESAVEDNTPSPSTDTIDENWLCSGLRVRIIDESYKKGQFLDMCGVIEDVNDIDRCVIITDSGVILDELSRVQLAPLPPITGTRARVLGGLHASVVVAVIEITGSLATVCNELLEEEFEIDTRLLCQLSDES